jgi:hypothetical protein
MIRGWFAELVDDYGMVCGIVNGKGMVLGLVDD